MESNARIRIKLFGRLEITVDGELVLTQLQQARKTCMFLEYLLLKRDRPVTHEELLDTLWSGHDSASPSTALRTLLHRYRSLVTESGITALERSIVTARGTYQWNPALACEIDVFEFERLYAEAGDTALPAEARIEKYLAFIELYSGPLLANVSEAAWVVPRSVYYHDMYLDGIFALIELLKAAGNHARIVQVCRRAMDVDLFDERLQLELMMALTKAGQRREALSQFCSTTSARALRSAPPGELRQVYNLIVQADEAMDNDIDAVQAHIENEPLQAGAFVCDYGIFREVFMLQRRLLERTSGTMFLALVTLGGGPTSSVDPLLLDSLMQQLLEICRQNLRKGDTVSRCGAAQYALLLPLVNYDSGKAVLERIKKAFYRAHVQSSLILSYKLRPLDVQKYK